MSGEFENRQKAIDGIITRIAMNNSNINEDQIARARSMYRYDTRSLEQIEKELEDYACQITLQASNRSPEKVERFVVVAEEPEILELDPKPVEQKKEPQTYIPGLSLDQSDPTDELDAMFDSRRNVTSDFDRVDSLGMNNTNKKVLVKTPPKPYVQNNVNNNSEGGYGTVISFITIASILSIVGIVISFIMLV